MADEPGTSADELSIGHSASLPANSECAICYGELKDDTFCKLNNCPHTYHRNCMGKWTQLSTSSCPTCRAEGLYLYCYRNGVLFEKHFLHDPQYRLDYRFSACVVCHNDEENEETGLMYICDGCEDGAHMACGPKRELREEENYYCPTCVKNDIPARREAELRREEEEEWRFAQAAAVSDDDQEIVHQHDTRTRRRDVNASLVLGATDEEDEEEEQEQDETMEEEEDGFVVGDNEPLLMEDGEVDLVLPSMRRPNQRRPKKKKTSAKKTKRRVVKKRKTAGKTTTRRRKTKKSSRRTRRPAISFEEYRERQQMNRVAREEREEWARQPARLSLLGSGMASPPIDSPPPAPSSNSNSSNGRASPAIIHAFSKEENTADDQCDLLGTILSAQTVLRAPKGTTYIDSSTGRILPTKSFDRSLAAKSRRITADFRVRIGMRTPSPMELSDDDGPPPKPKPASPSRHRHSPIRPPMPDPQDVIRLSVTPPPPPLEANGRSASPVRDQIGGERERGESERRNGREKRRRSRSPRRPPPMRAPVNELDRTTLEAPLARDEERKGRFDGRRDRRDSKDERRERDRDLPRSERRERHSVDREHKRDRDHRDVRREPPRPPSREHRRGYRSRSRDRGEPDRRRSSDRDSRRDRRSRSRDRRDEWRRRDEREDARRSEVRRTMEQRDRAVVERDREERKRSEPRTEHRPVEQQTPVARPHKEKARPPPSRPAPPLPPLQEEIPGDVPEVASQLSSMLGWGASLPAPQQQHPHHHHHHPSTSSSSSHHQRLSAPQQQLSKINMQEYVAAIAKPVVMKLYSSRQVTKEQYKALMKGIVQSCVKRALTEKKKIVELARRKIHDFNKVRIAA